jgi:hypothetical protein
MSTSAPLFRSGGVACRLCRKMNTTNETMPAIVITIESTAAETGRSMTGNALAGSVSVTRRRVKSPG